ncbi:MAG: hypothetical protein V7701_14605, partial [Sneathiella sp.]
SWTDLRGKETGRRIFVLANGPSILEEDLAPLKNEITIGMNASTILEKKWGFVTDYYTVSDERFLNNPAKRKWATNCLNEKTLRIIRADLYDYDCAELRENTLYARPLSRDGFSQDITRGFYYGSTTTMLALQLAYYLGSREIYLIGCDLRYPPETPRFYHEEKPQVEDSFVSVQISNIVNASLAFEKAGGILVNCSERSFLRPYMEFSKFSDITETNWNVKND